jgi:hypothetical protein
MVPLRERHLSVPRTLIAPVHRAVTCAQQGSDGRYPCVRIGGFAGLGNKELPRRDDALKDEAGGAGETSAAMTASAAA